MSQSETAPDDQSKPVRVSFVIPARDEQRTLPLALKSIAEAVQAAQVSTEMIVVNDASTDRTPEIAREFGARVVDVELHNIGAVRNAGASEATGEVLVFLDADTHLPTETLQAALAAIDSGAVGGGGWVHFEGISTWQRPLIWILAFGWQRLCGWASGCFIFCRREDFEAVGGFDQQYFAAEERYLTTALRQRGRFVMLRERVVTSGRKLRIYPTAHLLGVAFRAFVTNPDQVKHREGLEILYDAPREKGSE